MLLPLKQGLKRNETFTITIGDEGCYATSIKTRIETHPRFYTPPPVCQVVMLLPLKQGLKLAPISTQTAASRELLCYFH